MTTIERYLISQIFIGLLMAAAILIPLFSFLDVIEQLDDVGEGFYTTPDAFTYVGLLLPRRLVQLLPFIALLGNVIALGRLAMNHELLTMRAVGMSPTRISQSSLKVGIILLIVMAVLEQFVAPVLQQKAIIIRSEALEQSAELGSELGVWSKDKKHILHIGETENVSVMNDVEIFHLNEQGFVQEYVYAEHAFINNDREWRLQSVTRKTFNGTEVNTKMLEAMVWRPFLNSRQIATLNRPPESLSPTELYQYIRYLRQTGQQSDAYTLALWRKFGGGLITIAMILLSVPFVFGSVRTGIANRLVLAGITGLCVYLLDQIISNAGLLLDLSFPLVALTPGLVLIILAKVWLHRFA